MRELIAAAGIWVATATLAMAVTLLATLAATFLLGAR